MSLTSGPFRNTSSGFLSPGLRNLDGTKGRYVIALEITSSDPGGKQNYFEDAQVGNRFITLYIIQNYIPEASKGMEIRISYRIFAPDESTIVHEGSTIVSGNDSSILMFVSSFNFRNLTLTLVGSKDFCPCSKLKSHPSKPGVNQFYATLRITVCLTYAYLYEISDISAGTKHSIV